MSDETKGPQPPAEAQADEVVCLECGQPTMHMGQVCYACSHPAAKPAEAQPVGGDLLPCPFCGSDSADTGGMLPWVECTDCDASGPSCGTEEEAVAAWNRRTPLPSAPVGVDDDAEIIPLAAQQGGSDNDH